MPALQEAEDACSKISKNDITELKKLGNPPAGVRLVLSVVCMIFDKPPEKVMNPDTQKKENNYWITSVKMMNDPEFLSNILHFDKESLTQKIIDQL